MSEQDFNYNSTINLDANERKIIPSGKYQFTITNLEKGRYTPTPESKLPACPMVTVHVRVVYEGANINFKRKLFIHPKCEGFLAEFFKSIIVFSPGQKQFTMDFSTVIGKTGWLDLVVKKTQDQKSEYNDINKFLPAQPVQQQYSQQPPPAPPSQQQTRSGVPFGDDGDDF